MRAALIYNPSSGRKRGSARALAVQRELSGRGVEVELNPTERPGHAIHIARESATRFDVLVAVGGDGTINEVVNGMVEAAHAVQAGAAKTGAAQADGGSPLSCRLAIVPAGTVNVVAIELELPFPLKEACAVILGGKTRSLDLGKVNGRRFVLMAGAGIDAATIRRLDPRLKRRLRSLAFLGTGLAEGLGRPQPEFLVTVDGTPHRATFFVASNFRYYAGHLEMAPDADASDGLLDMMLFHGTSKPSLLAFWWRLLTRTHVRWRHVTGLRSSHAGLELIPDAGPVWLQADGEIVGELPATVEVEPATIEVLVP